MFPPPVGGYYYVAIVSIGMHLGEPETTTSSSSLEKVYFPDKKDTV